MDKILTWIDFLDHHTIAGTGEYMLYRNYFVLDQFDQLMYKYAEHPGSDERAKTSLYDTPPVARGFSAFYAHWLQPDQILPEALMNITYLDPPEYYEVYLKSAFKVFMLRNERSSKPLSRIEIKSKFFPEHIQREKTWFEQSHKFYSQCKDEEDQEFKDKLLADFNGYMAWLKEKAQLPFPTHVLSLQPSSKAVIQPRVINSGIMINNLINVFPYNSLHSENQAVTKSLPVPRTQNKKPKIDSQTLLDIWIADKRYYHQIIEAVSSKSFLNISVPLISIADNGMLNWNKSNMKYKSYLAGFFYACLLHGFITDAYTGSDYVLLIKNTFGITVDSSPYKAAMGKAKTSSVGNSEFLSPFQDIITIIKKATQTTQTTF